MSTTNCVLSHGSDEHGNPRQRSADIGMLCFHHRSRMTTTLVNIRELWFDLALILEAGSAPKDESPKTRHLKAAEAPAPANLDALALRDHRNGPTLQSGDVPAVVAVVASWLLLVAEERPLSAALPNSVLAQLELLAVHHDWIAQQGFVDDYVTEIEELRKALTIAVRDQTHRPRGRCNLPTETAPKCGGKLMEENGTGVIRCSDCRAQWTTPTELARLAVSLESA